MSNNNAWNIDWNPNLKNCRPCGIFKVKYKVLNAGKMLARTYVEQFFQNQYCKSNKIITK
jgi:hypothetical protein